MTPGIHPHPQPIEWGISDRDYQVYKMIGSDIPIPAMRKIKKPPHSTTPAEQRIRDVIAELEKRIEDAQGLGKYVMIDSYKTAIALLHSSENKEHSTGVDGK